MKDFAFISRHIPTDDQVELAAKKGIAIVPIGDSDAFTISAADIPAHMEGVIVVHPAAALRLARTHLVGIFRNENRAPVGERPQFKATSFEVYDLRG